MTANSIEQVNQGQQEQLLALDLMKVVEPLKAIENHLSILGGSGKETKVIDIHKISEFITETRLRYIDIELTEERLLELLESTKQENGEGYNLHSMKQYIAQLKNLIVSIQKFNTRRTSDRIPSKDDIEDAKEIIFSLLAADLIVIPLIIIFAGGVELTASGNIMTLLLLHALHLMPYIDVKKAQSRIKRVIEAINESIATTGFLDLTRAIINLDSERSDEAVEKFWQALEEYGKKQGLQNNSVAQAQPIQTLSE